MRQGVGSNVVADQASRLKSGNTGLAMRTISKQRETMMSSRRTPLPLTVLLILVIPFLIFVVSRTSVLSPAAHGDNVAAAASAPSASGALDPSAGGPKIFLPIVLALGSGPSATPLPNSTATPTATVPPGLTSTPTNTPSTGPTLTPTVPPVEYAFLPDADSYVNQLSPTTNFGHNPDLRTAATPIINSYLRFTVQGVTTPIAKASLQIFANSSQSVGYDVHTVADNSWNEIQIDYANAPAIAPNVVGSSGPFCGGTWTSVDVTSQITGDGTYGFALTSSNPRNTSYASRESGANAPRILIDVGGVLPTATALPCYTPTSTPTITSTPTATSLATATPTVTATSTP